MDGNISDLNRMFKMFSPPAGVTNQDWAPESRALVRPDHDRLE